MIKTCRKVYTCQSIQGSILNFVPIYIYGSIFGKRDLLAIDHISWLYFGVMLQL